jgi:hypothetical protein
MVRTSFVISPDALIACGSGWAAFFGFANEFQCTDQAGDELVQLALVIFGECSEDAVPFRGDVQSDATAVGGVLAAKDEACLFAALAELDDAVMAEA